MAPDTFDDPNYANKLRQLARSRFSSFPLINRLRNPEEQEELDEFEKYENSTSYEERREILKRQKTRNEIRGIKKELEKSKLSQKNTVCYSFRGRKIFLWFKNNETTKLSFSGNRLTYIKKIISSGPVPIKTLAAIGSTSEHTNISITIREINRRFRKEFTAPDDLIENADGRSGYSLNTGKYNFLLEN